MKYYMKLSVQNVNATTKIKRQGSFLLVLLLMCTILVACANNPKKDIVTSKNDGSMQNAIHETSSNNGSLEIEPSRITWQKEFMSTDGSVSFFVNINNEVSPDVRQVVEVIPHMLTEDDLQRVATVLLGDIQFYERRTSSNPQYSKSQYQEMIARMSPYATKERLADLMGASGAEVYLEYVQLFIESWTEEYESAPEGDPRTPCDWVLKKERVYNDSKIEIGNRVLDDDMNVLYANAQKNGVEYIYSVIRHSGKTHKLNLISLQLSEGIGLIPVDQAIYRSMLCRTEKPTEEQITAVSQEAQTMLEQMQLGEWEIVSTEVEVSNSGAAPEYTIRLQAQPLINGVSSILGQPNTAPQDAYAPTYQMTSAYFVFSANGDIVEFSLISPIDVIDVPNQNVSTISVDELAEKCMQQLSLSDRAAYGLPDYFIEETEDYTGEKLLCQVSITEAEYGLGRVKVPNTDDNYYYIPVLAFRGTVVYISDKSGTVYFDNSPVKADEKSPILLCINAIDGSIITN